ncbi:hypothetical protein ACVIW2_003875 [Bradyrhizobium huanghuaihaiense]|uniref:Uncharacterized protein n=1 Tax=Bradyrhizobium huanghuaihaiense TaxID=990078 RepID=A0A562R5F5_9BRAD|nr:hypothetical protein IQ16_06093 [Bradyrhizobium huanghuaihaiense]
MVLLAEQRPRPGAFLWTFIWSLPGTLKLRNLSFLGSDQMSARTGGIDAKAVTTPERM